MGAIAQLSTTTLDVEPGRTAEVTVTVRNTGSVVDRFTFDAVGDGAQWVTFTPDNLSLFPDASGTVSMVFAPPRAPTVVAGEVPFGVRVVSGEDASGSVVEEGTLTVSAFSQVSAELVPKIIRGRRGARVQVAVDNRSNCAYRAELVASDPSGELGFNFNPALIDVAPGGAEFVRTTVRPRKAFWRGPTTTKPFRVTLKAQPLTGPGVGAAGTAPPAGGVPTAITPAVGVPAPPPPGPKPALLSATGPHPAEVTTDGTLLQEAVLPKWLLKALAALVLLALLLVVLWFALLKPQIKSTANSQVAKQLSAAGVTSGGTGTGTGDNSSNGNGSPGGTAGNGGSSATTIANSSVTSPSGTGSGSGSSQTVNGTSQASGNVNQTVYVVPTGHVLQITDLLVENSAGNTGTIALARNGTILMEWSLANFRDLDYHWIAPTLFAAGNKLQMIVNNCSANCSPGIYYAGNLVKTG